MNKKLPEALLQKLRRTYTPLSVLDLEFKGKGAVFKTDEEGNPVVLFIGEVLPNGRIKGARYTRVLRRDRQGRIIIDHWDLKGKAD